MEIDERYLQGWLNDRYDVAVLTGDVRAGAALLDSIYRIDHGISAESLRRDRTECCRKRDAWPTRPTEIEPFGILDIEMAINFPDDAQFPFPELAYSPTEDQLVSHCIATYHRWNN